MTMITPSLHACRSTIKQKTAYEMDGWLEFRRVLFRSRSSDLAKVVPPEAMENAPASLHSLDVKSRDMRGQKYVLQVAPEDCTGCNLCVEVCPAKDRQNPEIKAINMMSRLEHVEEEKINYDFFLNLPEIDRSKLERIDIRTSQLIRSEERRVGKECRSRWSPYH